MFFGNRAFWLGAIGSAVFLAVFVVLFVDFETIGDVLAGANYAYLVPSIVFYFIAVWFRSARWKFLLRPLIGSPQKSIYSVVVVGYMANNLIPVRIGEVVRAYYLSLREACSAPAAFGTVAVERATDVLALLFFFAAAGIMGTVGVERAVGDISSDIPGGATVLALVALLPFVGVLAVVVTISTVSASTVLGRIDRMMFMLGKGVRARLLGITERLIEGLTVVSSPADLAKVFAWSLPVWASEAVMYYLIAIGFDLRPVFDSQVEFIAAVLVFTAAANLAGVLPSTAGSWGPFDFFGAAALVALGVGQEVAAAYALTVHVALWVPPTVVGGILLVMDGNSLSGLMKGAQANDQPIAGASDGSTVVTGDSSSV
ncbi:lysylphosphatidylglycerol synthase transmembrane domain-containing protein [Candidatus Lucifugimonas marina]|uniref:Flippase-like domain-containing protein n=1 Tax=Candidatus Lucifugimonas marina TaxID=3038979 RepID=A0AAJ6CSN3_9CHLR|nr:flippase-like domain-containing protein [SAR202 cluster bacterium JH702]MDG0868838.1 flippase-like domain-containing protein [SAR202 cluster bacterium JH639]WFG35466.1 flippase-like domain-containing protein [SAR202 cluster bacterium JH545]WFG39413.1 flippase-like domain-containing protein [SAR202 cluster bacterium JH1073]